MPIAQSINFGLFELNTICSEFNFFLCGTASEDRRLPSLQFTLHNEFPSVKHIAALKMGKPSFSR